ncbi:MAG: N-acetyltransferase [Parvularculaceae bacterium]
MNEVTIRQAGKADVGLLSAVGKNTFIETFGHLYDAGDLEKFLVKNHSQAAYTALLDDDRVLIWIAESQQSDCIGYCVAGPCGLPVPDMPASSGELSRLYLAKKFQKAGVGSALLELALQFLKLNFEHIYLSVYAENYKAQALYHRHGFEKIHDYFYMVGDHADPEWIMELKQ